PEIRPRRHALSAEPQRAGAMEYRRYRIDRDSHRARLREVARRRQRWPRQDPAEYWNYFAWDWPLFARLAFGIQLFLELRAFREPGDAALPNLQGIIAKTGLFICLAQARIRPIEFR